GETCPVELAGYPAVPPSCCPFVDHPADGIATPVAAIEFGTMCRDIRNHAHALEWLLSHSGLPVDVEGQTFLCGLEDPRSRVKPNPTEIRPDHRPCSQQAKCDE